MQLGYNPLGNGVRAGLKIVRNIAQNFIQRYASM